jgi:hypothetical protein
VLNITESSALLLWAPSAATADGYVITYSADSGEGFSSTISSRVFRTLEESENSSGVFRRM